MVLLTRRGTGAPLQILSGVSSVFWSNWRKALYFASVSPC